MSEVNALIESELDNAIKKHGKRFFSDHEAYAVAMEEVEEAKEDMNFMSECMHGAWNRIREDDDPLLWVEALERQATHLAQEAAQVAAVCRKWKKGRGYENEMQ